MSDMVAVIRADRSSTVLKPSGLACLRGMPAMNLAAGCAHGCLYCYARGYSTYPGHDRVVVYANVLDKLKAELPRKRPRPDAVYFSPSSDIFQPVPEALELCHSVLSYLLAQGVGVAFVTKGRIPDRTMALLLSHHRVVRAQIGIISMNEDIWRVFEPRTAHPVTRIEQMNSLASGGVAVEARIMPILPGITDSSEDVDRLLSAIRDAGVRVAGMSTLFLRPSIVASLRRGVPDRAMLGNLLRLYDGAARITTRAEESRIVPLPLPRRLRIYADMRRIASRHGLDLSVCGCMNTDIPWGTCNIGGRWLAEGVQARMFG